MEVEKKNTHDEQAKLDSQKIHKLMQQRRYYRRSGWFCFLIFIVVVIIRPNLYSNVVCDVLMVGFMVAPIVCFVAGANAKGKCDEIRHLRSK